MTDWVKHRQELLRAFRISEGDLDANHAGRLGPAQLRKMRRGIGTNLLGGAILAGGLVAILYFVAAHPLKPVQWIIGGGLTIACLTLGAVTARNLMRAIRAGVVERLSGPVRVNMRGRAGWYLTVQGRSFRLPVQFWHVGKDVTYDVYIAPAAKLIVAMEPPETASGT
jgi:hypothetical protein